MHQSNTIRLVVFDWAGTTVDYGSGAPVEVFERVFAKEGIRFTKQEINGPMGMEKKTHIRALLNTDSGNRQWEQTHGRQWNEEDVERLYQDFEEELVQIVAGRSVPIPGVVDTVKRLRESGLKIGSTTGYHSRMMKEVIPKAEQLGYRADCVVTPDVVGSGRPGPFMIFECMRQLNVYPPCAVIKVGDTVADILEGKNAGVWSVGILTGSNLLGLSEEEYKEMDPETLIQRKEDARRRYLEAGADMVIDSICELPDAVTALNERLKEEK